MNFSEFFESIGVPAFGTKVCEPVNCGAGLAIEDSVSGGADDSYMVVIGDVTPKMFRDFLASLASSGRKETFHREVNGNIFSEFAEENRIIYTYFTREAEQARVIIDNASCPLSEMNDNEPDVRGDTALMQFSLKYGSMVRYHSCDCGMLYVLRLRDNSVIIIDGGEIEQATEEACDEFMRRLEDLTNTEKGGKIRVAAWICTHNHDDHMDVFTKLLKREKDILCVERVMFNFPSRTLLDYSSGCTDRLRERLKKYAPNAKYLSCTRGRRYIFRTRILRCLQRTRIYSRCLSGQGTAAHIAA